MSAGNDFWATKAGNEFLAAVKNIYKGIVERNKIEEEKLRLMDNQNKLLAEQIEVLRNLQEELKGKR